MVEGPESGSIPLTSGSDPRGPIHLLILRIQIRNTNYNDGSKRGFLRVYSFDVWRDRPWLPCHIFLEIFNPLQVAKKKKLPYSHVNFLAEPEARCILIRARCISNTNTSSVVANIASWELITIRIVFNSQVSDTRISHPASMVSLNIMASLKISEINPDKVRNIKHKVF
jgi:hypothetical protein